MAISPIGPLGGTPLPESNGGDRRFTTRMPSPTSAPATPERSAGDSVSLSETARGMANAAAAAQPKLRLSPADLQAMIALDEEDPPPEAGRDRNARSSNPEGRHVR